jgi:hypothetical protein
VQVWRLGSLEVWKPAATADGLLAGPALQAAEGRQELRASDGEGHGAGHREVGRAAALVKL